MTPKRIQRERTKGYKQPSKTFYMGRKAGGSIYANPYLVEEYGRDEAVDRHMNYLRELKLFSPDEFNARLDYLRQFENLSCWCPLEVRCHVDNWLYFLKGETE